MTNGKIETYQRIANLWADHFGVEGEQRQRLVERYVSRCQQQRFWCVPVGASGAKALCRLGNVMVYFDGRLLHTTKIHLDMDGTETVYGKPLDKAVPAKIYANRLAARAAAHVKQKPTPPMDFYDSLTTFSRGYRDLVAEELDQDLAGVVRLIPELQTRAMRFIRPRAKFYNGTGAARLKELCARLDPDILRTIRSAQCPSMSLYNWIASGDKTRRIQAVKSYPFLVPLLILSAENYYLQGYEEPRAKADEWDWDLSCRTRVTPRLSSLEAQKIGQHIDAGEKLGPLLSDLFKEPQAAIRQLAKHSIYHTGSALRHIGRQGWTRNLWSYTDAQKLGNRKPKNKASWRTWMALDSALYGALRQQLNMNEDWARLLSGTPPLDDPRWQELLARVKDLRDIPIDDVEAKAIKDWTLPQILNLSERWHTERARYTRVLEIEDEHASSSVDSSWPSLLAEPFEAEGLRIIELNTPELLHQEARRLSHCVDGYSTFCYDGKSRILSVRKGDESMATMELRLRPFKKTPGRSHLFCAQLRGYENATFDGKSPVAKAATKLLRQIRSGKVAVTVEWPVVPYERRPERMRFRNDRILRHMMQWLRAEVGVAARQERPRARLAPAA